MKKTRLNLEVSQEVRDQLTRLTVQTRSPSVTETIRRSVSIAELLAHFMEQGGEIIHRRKNGTHEVLKFV